MTTRIEDPLPPLVTLDIVMEKCIGCETYQLKGHFLSEVFICEDCATDGDALAAAAIELASKYEDAITLTDEELSWLLENLPSGTVKIKLEYQRRRRHEAVMEALRKAHS